MKKVLICLIIVCVSIGFVSCKETKQNGKEETKKTEVKTDASEVFEFGDYFSVICPEGYIPKAKVDPIEYKADDAIVFEKEEGKDDVLLSSSVTVLSEYDVFSDEKAKEKSVSDLEKAAFKEIELFDDVPCFLVKTKESELDASFVYNNDLVMFKLKKEVYANHQDWDDDKMNEVKEKYVEISDEDVSFLCDYLQTVKLED